MESLESMWRTYEAIGEWIRAADLKVSVLLGAEGIMVGFISSRLLVQIMKPALTVLLIAYALSALATLFCCVMCIKPMLKAGEPTSTIYFDHISRRYSNGENFAKDIINQWGKEGFIEKEVSCQIWAIAKVASRKHSWVAASNWTFVISALFGVVLVIF